MVCPRRLYFLCLSPLKTPLEVLLTSSLTFLPFLSHLLAADHLQALATALIDIAHNILEIDDHIELVVFEGLQGCPDILRVVFLVGVVEQGFELKQSVADSFEAGSWADVFRQGFGCLVTRLRV
jgi:hypothetical protein